MPIKKPAWGLQDINVAEVHDTVAPIELLLYEQLGLCGPGQSGKWIDEGATALGGRVPVNPSGGLSAKGHPAGATGLAQLGRIGVAAQGRGRREAGAPPAQGGLG